ncbi:MAG: hypothetical protein JXN59_11440 [Anaerolineae bacterium]|nr:hypothetical protein [Anaerolineae bacterium]
MHIPRHWRLNSQRYALQGVTCPNCSNNIFPPREVCPYCESRAVEVTFDFEMPGRKPAEVMAVLEHAAR